MLTVYVCFDNRVLPTAVGLENVAEKFRKHQLHGLLIIGGFEAFQSVLAMAEARDKHPEFCIPMIVIPSTISNNIPGTDFSLGADTALNEIADVSDGNFTIYVYKTEKSVCLSVCLSITFREGGCRGRRGGWTGRRGAMGRGISMPRETGRGDFYDGIPGWTYFSRAMPGHPASAL